MTAFGFLYRCWFCRKAISFGLDSGRPLSKPVENHLAACPDCRSYRQMQQRLVEALTVQSRTAAAKAEADFPPFLHAKTMGSIRRTAMIRRTRAPVLKWVGALTVLAGLLLAVLVMRNQRTEETPPSLAQASDPVTENGEPTGSDGASEATMPLLLAVDMEKLQRWTAPLEQPLQEEIQLVLVDTKTALNGLANSFFPEKLRETVFGAQRN